MSKYEEVFFENDVDGDTLFDADLELLYELGVDLKKDRIKIKSKFKQWLRENSSKT